MSVTAKWYGQALLKALGANPVNWTGDTIKIALCTSAYTPDQDNHVFFSDVTNEITGAGYSAGGATLGSATAGYTGATNVIKLSGANTSWANSTLTARYAVIYKSTGTASTSLLMGYVDFGADVSSNNGTFQVTWDAAGILTITPA